MGKGRVQQWASSGAPFAKSTTSKGERWGGAPVTLMGSNTPRDWGQDKLRQLVDSCVVRARHSVNPGKGIGQINRTALVDYAPVLATPPTKHNPGPQNLNWTFFESGDNGDR
jgi:hypothetical protein